MIKHTPLVSSVILLLVLCSSCHSLRNISSRDNSGTARINKKKTTKDVKFLDDIEMKPGGVVMSKHKTSGIKKSNSYHYSEKTTNSNVEDANWLQYKYAIITDVEVESFNNVSLLQKIDEWWGTRYCIGGETKECTDCSGFSGNIFRDVYNLQLPRTAQDQYSACDKITTDELKEGDLVFFHTRGRSISHVGIYLTNNKFVHASSSEGVTISDLNDKYWQPRFVAAGRVRK